MVYEKAIKKVVVEVNNDDIITFQSPPPSFLVDERLEIVNACFNPLFSPTCASLPHPH